MNNRVLIVEDETRLREVLCDYFRSRGDTPFQAADGLRQEPEGEYHELPQGQGNVRPEMDPGGFRLEVHGRRDAALPHLKSMLKKGKDHTQKGVGAAVQEGRVPRVGAAHRQAELQKVHADGPAQTPGRLTHQRQSGL